MKRVYFIKPIGMDGPIKIGCSKEPQRRLYTLELWCPFPLEVLAEYEGDGRVERQFHGMFAADHVRHEWFNATPRLLSVIAAIRDGNFDASVLPDPKHLPRRPKDLSYITPEWRARHGEQIREAHAWRKERKAQGHHARPSGQFAPSQSTALSPKEDA